MLRQVGPLELLVIALLFAAASAWVATRRGRSSVLWAVLGFVFGVFALLAVAVLPDQRQRTG